jgi:hypothetical protein
LALAPHFTTLLARIDDATAHIKTFPHGKYQGDGEVPEKHHECANVIVLIIIKIIKLLFRLIAFLTLIPKLVIWFAACDKAISLLLTVLGSLLFGTLVLVKVLYVESPALDRSGYLTGSLLTGSSTSCSSSRRSCSVSLSSALASK